MLAVYPGSFDPVTHGHIDLIERASKIFKKVIVLVANSSKKQYTFSFAERKKLLEQSLGKVKGVEIQAHDGITTDYVKSVGAKIIIRGVRSASDFDHEIVLAQMNKKLAPDVETFILFPKTDFQFFSSSAIKEVAQAGGKLDAFVPKPVAKALKEKFHAIR